MGPHTFCLFFSLDFIDRNIRQIRLICQIFLINWNFGKTQLTFFVFFVQISRFGYAGANTNIADALDLARTSILSETSGSSGNRPQYKDIVVLLSDGEDNTNTHQEVAEAAKNLRNFGGTNNLHVIAVGIGGYYL